MRFIIIGSLAIILVACSALTKSQYEDEDFKLLNAQKQRSALPGRTLDVTIAQIVGWSHGYPMPPAGLPREKYSKTDRDYVYAEERNAVRVSGYLLKAEAQPDGDIHLYLGERDDADLGGSIISEMTPSLESSKSWSAAKVQRYQGQQVRISGWLLWDEQHGKGSDRATSWEIHPVTEFEVLDSGAWHPI
jgi:hypothetical protein